MTFTRRSDSATLNPIMVVAPFEQSSETGTIARRIAQSNEVRVTYVGSAGPREGTIVMLFNSYSDANAARAFMSAPSLFEFDGIDTASTSDYVIVDDYILETADASAGDYAIVFAVTAPVELTGTGGAGWSIRVPYIEVPE